MGKWILQNHWKTINRKIYKALLIHIFMEEENEEKLKKHVCKKCGKHYFLYIDALECCK